MHAQAAEMKRTEAGYVPYQVRDVAMDVGLLMVAATFILLGGAGLVSHALGVAYPLSGLMAADAALTGFLAGLCLLSWLYDWRKFLYLAALPLGVITLYTLGHNALAGSPWVGTSLVTGGNRILSSAALLLLLFALSTALGMKGRWRRILWIGSGLLMLAVGCLSLAMMLIPASRVGWASGFVSAPMLATLFALLGGIAILGGAWRGARQMLPLGRLPQLTAIAGVMASCLAWYVLTWNAQTAIQQRASTLLDNAELNTRRLMGSQLVHLQRLAWRQGLDDASLPGGLWDRDVDAYLRHAPYLQALSLIGADGELEDLRTLLPVDQRREIEALTGPAVRDWLSMPWSEPRVMRDPLDPTSLLLAAPVGEGGRHLIARLDPAHLLARELGVQLNLFRLSIGGAQPLLELRQPGRDPPADLKRPMPHLGERQVGLPGGASLTLDVYMDSLPDMLRAGLMPGGFAIAGLTLSYFLALSLGLVRLLMRRSRELLAAQKRLAAQYDIEQRYRSLYLYHPDGVFSLDRHGDIVTANAACREITGRRDEDVLGSHFSRLLEAADIERMQALFASTLAGEPGRVELPLKHRDGHLKSIDLTTLPIIVEGVTQGVFGIAKDITQQREHEAQIAYQACHDLLTGLPNRSVLDECLEEAFHQARREHRLMVVMHLDLDGFKTVNDGLGYHVGNRLLVAVADRLRELVRPGDTVARLASDEFCLLIPSLESREAGSALAERILDTLSRPYEIDGKPLHVSSSMGIAGNDPEVRHAKEMLQRADLAMSGAKRQGRNTWQWYQGDSRETTEEDVLLRHDLYTALRDEQFELYYQPIVEAGSGLIRGFEALVRWHHPERGMISPGLFIPLAEQTGQIIPLGRWVLNRACRDAVVLLAEKPEVASVAVNISSLQFRRTGFLADVERALADSGLPPAGLELEVTESILLDGAAHAIDLINQLRAMGIRVALDDFGTGFSSLSYLRDLPIHKVKLDLAFIQDITINHRNAAIVQGVITMSHHMDMVVVAEGIETAEQQQDMIRRGCDLLQGFYFARPAPLSDTRALPEALYPGEADAAYCNEMDCDEP